MPNKLEKIGNDIGQAIENMGAYSAKAAIQANAVSAQSQAAQGAFNQASADNANTINQGNMQSQWGFNSAMMSSANEYNANMWQKAADWNEAMWERQAEFNAQQAQIQRDWSERMENTRYQRAIKDMESAGLNPILAVSGGGSGIATGAGSGSAASVGGAQMSSASSQMASGGLLGANSASEGNYTGQMEYMSGILGLISASIGSFSSAFANLGNLGDFGQGLGEALASMFKKDNPVVNIYQQNKEDNKGKEWYQQDPVQVTAGKYLADKFKNWIFGK